MEFFGLTYYGPQNYIKDMMKEEYEEPMSKDEVIPLMEHVLKSLTCPEKFQKPDVHVIRIIDCYMGRVNGFAYGSIQRFNKMKRKAVMKPIGPAEMYRLAPTTSVDYGWWQCDPALVDKTWYLTTPRYPQPSSPNTLILDKVKQNNKYASLF